jgi:penicillin-binding protein-related factor A (putative recombinase)
MKEIFTFEKKRNKDKKSVKDTTIEERQINKLKNKTMVNIMSLII